MTKKVTEKIHIWGIVQGVGFRPFVAKLADKHNIKGEVLNIGGLVEIVITHSPEKIKFFLEALVKEKPKPSEIIHIKREEINFKDFKNFTILKSSDGGEDIGMIPADLAFCPECLEEMETPENHRYRHAFISCMICGPRYTIINKIPYDRENTSMEEFSMCESCTREYTSLEDRRYHAQTISCNECGPQIKSYVAGENKGQEDPLGEAVTLLKEGKVIAFKSMGGYNLMADPFDEKAVLSLRSIKKRDYKPFAIMFSSTEEVKKYCLLNSIEEKILNSSARPILLLEKKVNKLSPNRFVGAFLPSMGGQHILVKDFGGPLIVTSANISGQPLIKGENEIFQLMEREPLISGVFYNERKIKVAMDDSVVRVIDNQPQIIRRSKGYAPVPLYIKGAEEEVLATGGQLKNSFSLSKKEFIYPSQFFGDMDTVENQKRYEKNIERMKTLFKIKPKKVACDLHPLYYTTKFAEKYAEENSIPLIKIQHHHAHIASVMAENNLEEKVIGVAFDGTGYGTDGAIWGGEFLLCQGSQYKRVAHLEYVKLIGGDSSMKDGWKSAVSHMHSYGSKELNEYEFKIDISNIIDYAVKNKTLDKYPMEMVKKAIENNVNVVKSSSMGRLFDGVAAMLGICYFNSYEGQCAIMLEDAAARALEKKEVTQEEELALEFHNKVASLILEKCIALREETGAIQVALSGGVFQNKVLMEKTLELLRAEKFQTYYNISVSPNDGGIALGQGYLATRQENGIIMKKRRRKY